MRVIAKKSKHKLKKKWMTNPRMTVSMYMPSCSAVLDKLGMLMILPATRHMIPKGEYLKI